MNAIRRNKRASLPDRAKSSTATCYVVGVGMVGTGTHMTEGDLVVSQDSRILSWEPRSEANPRAGDNEESERFIVAMTPVESREQRRDCSLKGNGIDL